jgi:hypothetical protein
VHDAPLQAAVRSQTVHRQHIVCPRSRPVPPPAVNG